MSTDNRIVSLQEKHAQLQLKLKNEETRPMPDEVAVHQLKREKLAIKDELASMGV